MKSKQPIEQFSTTTKYNYQFTQKDYLLLQGNLLSFFEITLLGFFIRIY